MHFPKMPWVRKRSWKVLPSKANNYVMNYGDRLKVTAFWRQKGSINVELIHNFKHPQLSYEIELAKLLGGTLKQLHVNYPSRTLAPIFRQVTNSCECTYSQVPISVRNAV